MPVGSTHVDRRSKLVQLCLEHGVLAMYLFGSRADDGLRLLDGGAVVKEGSDLDIGIVFARSVSEPSRSADLQVAMEDLFAPLRVDLVPLQKVDSLFQFDGIDGHRIVATDSTAADEYELGVMRRAAELLPIERRLQQEFFGSLEP
ncbi:MAG: nucleotidyltransferase domain-containing protein [Holophagales bacterium]|nr:nucleotidyltransferase domain-containing protein [Holophagales bacterium]